MAAGPSFLGNGVGRRVRESNMRARFDSSENSVSRPSKGTLTADATEPSCTRDGGGDPLAPAVTRRHPFCGLISEAQRSPRQVIINMVLREFLTNWALHGTTVDVIFHVVMVVAISTTPHRPGSPQCLLMVPREFSNQGPVLHLSGNVDNLVKVQSVLALKTAAPVTAPSFTTPTLSAWGLPTPGDTSHSIRARGRPLCRQAGVLLRPTCKGLCVSKMTVVMDVDTWGGTSISAGKKRLDVKRGKCGSPLSLR
eukprot:bmy_18863T0